MVTVRIHDLKEHVLVPDLKELLQLLAPQSLQANWTISTVKSSDGYEWFETTGAARSELDALAQRDARISGSDLRGLAENTHQVIWGEFIGSIEEQSDETWLIIRAIDSTFYEIETRDTVVLSKINSKYRDVRSVAAPVTS
ncbi:hypothetical protein [Rhizobium sp. C4]|uniref:hypothetical protein n=1 Tax=Rhizobium sp. C4 TaxID=1349800 RepID=UPI001E57B124|nr:hypothetical protein [Rhizobium sp. C4]MCD2172812.1 hypothetical protein [Rhizobium sp. C4]